MRNSAGWYANSPSRVANLQDRIVDALRVWLYAGLAISLRCSLILPLRYLG